MNGHFTLLSFCDTGKRMGTFLCNRSVTQASEWALYSVIVLWDMLVHCLFAFFVVVVFFCVFFLYRQVHDVFPDLQRSEFNTS